ncbi:MAG: alpha/beta hydrolase [Archangium sp.]
MKRLAPLLTLALLGCGLAAPRSAESVTDGVGRARFETRAAGSDLVEVTVLFPANDDGSLRGKSLPAVVFVQGGFVATSRYEWQAIELAKAGYVVALAENQWQLAFFSLDANQAARALLVTPPSGSVLVGAVDANRIAVAGHSLGSVSAMKLALEGDFQAVVLEAGYPDTADDSKLPAFARPSLSLAGTLDCSARLADVQSGWAKLPSPTALVTLDGVTHYQFTDSQKEDEQKGCTPTLSLETAHTRIAQALLAFLDSALSDGTVNKAAFNQVGGATVEVR